MSERADLPAPRPAPTAELAPDSGALLAPIAAAAAAGRLEVLARALDAALAAGCASDVIREALLMLAPFGGFPRTLDALSAFREALGRAGMERPRARPAAPRTRHAADGREMFGRVYGTDAERVLERLTWLDDEVAAWVLEDAYGRVLSRPGLHAAQRERLAVVLLCALGLRNQLSGHVRGALRCGATVQDVEGSLRAAGALLPIDCVDAARRALARAVSEKAEDEQGAEQ